MGMIFLEREGMEMLLNEQYQDAFFTVHATVLYGSPSRCLTRLQCIQNSLERIVLQQPSLSSRDTLQQLHWLPVKWQIQFKLAPLPTKFLTPVLRHVCLNASIPYVPSRTLPSSSSANLYVPRTNFHFVSRSFYTAAQTVWNSLPSILRSSQTLNTGTFRKHLKTHLYQSAFNSP